VTEPGILNWVVAALAGATIVVIVLLLLAGAFGGS
jgi:hypothetical protein